MEQGSEGLELIEPETERPELIELGTEELKLIGLEIDVEPECEELGQIELEC